MMELKIRKSQKGDLESLLLMFAQSRSEMRSAGNSRQWVDGYPQRELVMEDIAMGRSYVVTAGGEPVGTFVMQLGEEPTYRHIYRGHWIDASLDYVTLHRMARRGDVHGIASAAIAWSRSQSSCVRMDTHEDNHIMRHIARQHDFVYCGMIQLHDGSWRRAYQHIDYPQVNPSLRSHIERCVLSCYDRYERGHDRQHILAVIGQSMALARHYAVDAEMVYVVAAYHDIGIAEGRALHHLTSARRLREDAVLSTWFDANQIAVMAEAVEDHRASSSHAPRSLYGRIVAEADRDIDSEKILVRTIQYGRAHYPQLDSEEQWQRFRIHLQEKYGVGGYVQLWLPESGNAERLESLRELISDESRLREAYERLQRPEEQSGADDEA